MSVRKEWKKNQISRGKLNEEIYEFVEAGLINFKTQPLSEPYNDSRLITREIVDNLYQYNTANKIIVTLAIDSGSSELTICIFHDGDEFDPFNPENNCRLLAAMNKQYKFNTTFQPNTNGNYELNLKLKLI